MNKYVLASSNKNKLREIKEKLKKFDILSLDDIGFHSEIDETGSTFHENSYIKTLTIFHHCGIDTISDDSGLIVSCLNGRPGVFSARYAGSECNTDANIRKLLNELKDQNDRQAKFKTVICLKNKSDHFFFTGECHGEITRFPQGKNGFGYDSIFVPNGFDDTFAQMPFKLKNKISHRSKAIEKLVNFLI